MVSSSIGLLNDNSINELIEKGSIKSVEAIEKRQVQPASLDLRLGEVGYRISASFLPGVNSTVEEKLHRYALHEFNLKDGAVLETNCVYLIPLQEELDLDINISSNANPKSSTGRLDIFTRVISDYAQSFNNIVSGYKGRLYLEISPQTFPIIVRKSSRLAQLRFYHLHPKWLSSTELEQVYPYPKGAEKLRFLGDAMALSVDLSGSENGIIGYRARKHAGIIDIDKVGCYSKADFWEPLYTHNDRKELVLDPEQFYILCSNEYVAIAENLAAEMVAFDPLVGEFRVHYAGFFDPGFGLAPAAPSRAVLEVRSYDIPFILEHKQIIGKLLFESIAEKPNQLYGEAKGSNYQSQNLKLSKHFF